MQHTKAKSLRGYFAAVAWIAWAGAVAGCSADPDAPGDTAKVTPATHAGTGADTRDATAGRAVPEAGREDGGVADSSSATNLLFWSGFEGPVSPATPADCYGNGCWQDIVGTDTTTGFSWPPEISGSSGRFQLLVNGPHPDPTTVYNFMSNKVVAVTGHTGAQTHALYSEITQSGCCGTSGQGNGSTQDPYLVLPTSDVPDLYLSEWVMFQADFVQKLLAGDAWRCLFEIKTKDTDWRLSLCPVDYGKTGTPAWQVRTDTYVPTNIEYWRATGGAVPVGQWFKVEVYWHRSSGPDGRVWVAVDGQVLADKAGPNMGPNKGPIDRIFVSQLYSGGSYPIFQWVDDVQMWSTFPTAAPGDPWYNAPYATH